MHLRLLVFAFLFLAGSSSASAQSWDTRFGGPSNSVTSFDVNEQGDVYAFGTDYLGSFLVRGIGRWDGYRWHREQPNDSLRALIGVYRGDGDLFVYAQRSDGQQSFRQRINGQWSIAGSAAAPGHVNVLKEAPDGRVCFGGEIRNLFPNWTAGFACWNGSEWWYPQSIGGGVGTIINDILFDAQGRIYIGGSFAANPPGARPIYSLVRLDGDQTEQLGDGLPAQQAVVSDMIFDSDSALVVVGYGWSGGGRAPFVYRFADDVWTEIPSPEGLQFSSSSGQHPFFELEAEADGGLLVIGRTNNGNIWLRRNGTEWTNADADFPGGPESAPNGSPIAYHDLGGGTRVLVGQYLAPVSGTFVHMLEERNGTWRPFGLSIGDAVLALATLPDGLLLATSENFHTGIARWTGSNWEPFGTDLCPEEGTRCRPLSIAVAPNGNVAVGGNFGNQGSSVVYGVAEWDGTKWTSLGGGTFQQFGQVLAYDADSRLYGQFGLTLGTGISPGFFQPTR